MKKIIRWGILGPGKIANRLAESFKFVDDAKIVAVASRDEKKAKAFAAQYNIPVIHTRYEALATDANVDIIYVATPHSHHHEHTLLCLRHGKAVLCEKPLTLNVHLAKEMVDTARKNNVFLMEAMWSRFFPAMIKAKQLIEGGAIGKVKYLRADFGFKGTFDATSRLYDMNLGGGAQLDVGIYPLFLSLYLFGRPRTVKASANLSVTGADETTNALLTFPNGVVASLLSSIVMDTPKDAEIIGTEGTVTIHTPWHKSMLVTVRTTGGEEQLFDFPYEGNGFQYQVQEVTRCMQEGLKECPMLSMDFSLMMTEVSDAIRTEAAIRYPADR